MSKAISRRLSLCALAGVLAGVLTTACTTAPSPPAVPTPVPTPKDSAAVPRPVAARWTPRLSAGSWRYELQSTGAVSLAGDTTADSLPLGRTVIYTVALAPLDGASAGDSAFRLTGSVDSVTVTIPERIPTPTAGSNSNPHFQGTLAADGHVQSIASDATISCNDATDPLSAAAALLFVALPKGISPSDSWTDTVSTTTCRNRMPLVATARRQYRALTDTVWRGMQAIVVARTDSLEIHSRPDTASENDSSLIARAKREPMEATGRGLGDYTLYVDPRSGVLLGATGTTHTEILVTKGSSSFPFREEARQTITLLK